ncbi:hypothetical protein BJP41_09250 [Candidatus Williamhamiltonella defendens]|uniref:Toxin-antitoxin system, antitoxin component n=3 Tax=Candidatus Williamhamiltonella defendens TaxID=138072 RepID=A0A2D3T9L1_9ENTR|nr:hypothetical protein BJP44_09715 [Candidatus Hamiltonella defensa]ATW23268.1 hypothetical protein BJP44_09750 [Candidatus Hamiltonella defensa]ATW30478.1 hypothetical protein BJP41_09250 [Candidatus Hamiltonella defensa]ATW32489.1 hypothetical protein BJP42_09560 [Candidatus Hamiltonella defensa]
MMRTKKNISVLFQHDVQPALKGRCMNKCLKSAQKPEKPIDFSDIPETCEKDWVGASRGQFYRPIKKQLTVRIDADVLEWLKSEGDGYQSRLNRILRSAMLSKIQS